ncbi:hypothetical protein C8T65DRAFT_746798 [Cerioporus squamosus]|nr:hypothetical protein C8T65DRAFT_746798 [Cerioporus squamosus]
MDFTSTIYLRQDAGAAQLPELPLTDVLVVVDGPTAVKPLVLVLPVDQIEQVTAPKISGWLSCLTGSDVQDADMDASQHNALFTLVYGYRTFLQRPTGVLDTDWHEFTSLFTRAARSLGPLDSAEAALVGVTAWLVDCFPETAFTPVHDHHREEEPQLAIDSEARRVKIVATLAMMLDPRLRNALREQFGTKTTESASASPAAADISTVTATSSTVAPSRRARKRAAQKEAAARRAAEAAIPLDHALPLSFLATAALPDTKPTATPCAFTPTSLPVPAIATPLVSHIPGTPVQLVTKTVTMPSLPVHVPGTPILIESAAFKIPVVPVLSEAAKGKRPAATLETNDEASGAESDNSMPSLQTVSNSSNGEDEEYVDDDDSYYGSD